MYYLWIACTLRAGEPTCAGPGEPADHPRRAYFRQANNAPRGQIAKIVYGALTTGQGCVLQR